MNLELIRKYEKEFLHMLHGGKVLMGKRSPITNTTKWYPSVLNPFEETSDTIVIVINDMYLTYRKALAEGRDIQFFNTKERLYDSTKPLHTWQDIDTIKTYGLPSDYRIKPEEPKFKVGDWVIELRPDVDDYCYRKPSGEPFQIKEVVKGNTGWLYKKEKDNYSRELFEDNLSAWKPKEGEICIFWSDGTYSAVIGIFSHMNQEKYVTNTTQKWSNCMPFTGILPPHMKD